MSRNDPDFVAACKRQLEDTLQELLQLNEDTVDSVAAVTLDQSKVGRLSRIDALQGQAIAQEARRRRVRTIARSRAALQRIEIADYGDCDECGVAINPKRLEMDPAVALCIDCATAREQT